MVETNQSFQSEKKIITNELLEKYRKRIDINCNGMAGDGIDFIKKDGALTKEEDVTNKVFDGLMSTLFNISEGIIDNIENGKVGQKEFSFYFKTLDAIGNVSFFLNLLADDKVPLIESVKAEADAKRFRKEDVFFLYDAVDILYKDVEGKTREGSFFVSIRPKEYINVLSEKAIETAAPRMSVNFKPKNWHEPEIEMRIDYQNFSNIPGKSQIVYDLVVGSNELNLVDQLNMSDKLYDHHFASNIRPTNLNLSFQTIMETFNKKIKSNIKR